MSSTNAETREIQIDRNIALHHIYSQAGTIEKAFGEACMNSADAGATEIHIEIADDCQHYVITDNGSGFASKEEILECFERLGFDHTTEAQQAKARKYGTFGLGRAQLWAWSKNTWKSGPYRMTVDTLNRGLEYDLLTEEEPISGCQIEGEFYEPISLKDMPHLRKGLKELTRFMELSVYFNGEQISMPLQDMSWSRKTEDAFFKFTETGGLSIYNQGFLVTTYPKSKFGVSGVVVTQKNLTLNVARNDIMVNRCKLWPNITEVLREKAREVNQKSTETLTENDRITLLSQYLNGDSDQSLTTRPIIKAVDGRFYSIRQLRSRFDGVVCFGNRDYSPVGETIINHKVALVVSPNYADSVGFPIEDWLAAFERNRTSRWEKEVVLADYEELAEQYHTDVQVLDPKTLSKKRKVALKVLERLSKMASQCTNHFTGQNKIRSVHLGFKEGAEAWTDGMNSIGYDADRLVRNLEMGFKGLMDSGITVIHEYCHTSSNLRDHSHDVEFYKTFHDSMGHFYIHLNDLHMIFKMYCKELIRAGLTLPKQVARDIPEKHESDILKELEKRDLLAS